MGRGPHAADRQLFAPDELPALRSAAHELGWLLERGYSSTSALKLVGDRHRLRARQRAAVARATCRDGAIQERRRRQLAVHELRGRDLEIDGFNCIITIEAALQGGVILRSRDGALRDLASVHGTYREVGTTTRALELLTRCLAEAGPRSVKWLLDRPVSNSGQLRARLLALAPAGLDWKVELPFDPDRQLSATPAVVASSDGEILDRCGAWIDLPQAVLEPGTADVWLIDLSGPDAETFS